MQTLFKKVEKAVKTLDASQKGGAHGLVLGVDERI